MLPALVFLGLLIQILTAAFMVSVIRGLRQARTQVQELEFQRRLRDQR
ncbi:MAG: hypothetical protein L0I17_01680 [Actinomycetia bacterium]|nr:hypothetical protein [Actinomycetes bacterium]